MILYLFGNPHALARWSRGVRVGDGVEVLDRTGFNPPSFTLRTPPLPATRQDVILEARCIDCDEALRALAGLRVDVIVQDDSFQATGLRVDVQRVPR